ncbi:MAG: DUF4364 family protein [Lachnospiraceae bacterium]|jgi:hypothetical protein|nr:DUF4364 family protein [Lachnospiraceae bacterium]
MPQDTVFLHKLIVLYLLSQADFPLTTAQISDFMLVKEYTLFPTLQIVIEDLKESALIQSQTIANRTLLFVTPEGRETLNHFENQIHAQLRKQIKDYLYENRFALRKELAIFADYHRLPSGEYEVRLRANDEDVKLMELHMTVPVKDMAETICEHWHEHNEEIYQYLTQILL